MPLYRMVGFFRPSLSKTEVGTVLRGLSEVVINSGGAIARMDNFGVHPLAQRLSIHNKWHRKGWWYQVLFYSNPEIAVQLQTMQKTDRRLLRNAVLKLDRHPFPITLDPQYKNILETTGTSTQK